MGELGVTFDTLELPLYDKDAITTFKSHARAPPFCPHDIIDTRKRSTTINDITFLGLLKLTVVKAGTITKPVVRFPSIIGFVQFPARKYGPTLFQIQIKTNSCYTSISYEHNDGVILLHTSLIVVVQRHPHPNVQHLQCAPGNRSSFLGARTKSVARNEISIPCRCPSSYTFSFVPSKLILVRRNIAL